MKKPSRLEEFLWRTSDYRWFIWHKLGRHKWIQAFTGHIVINKGVIAHKDGTPPSIECEICGKLMTKSNIKEK